MASRYSVIDSFTITTPSLSVVIRADDTPLPSDVKPQPDAANLVTVQAVEPKESGYPSSKEKKTGQITSEEQPLDPEQQQEQEALRQRRLQQQRLWELQSMEQLTQDQLKELKDLQERENAMRDIEAEEMKEQVGIMNMLQRAQSKHADMIYGRFGAQPPIQPLDSVVTEEDSEGFIRKLSTYVTKDFTHWDKLRRHNTQTVIRRWHTYVIEGEEDTAFFERNIQANVPADSYKQGIYYKELDINWRKEYKLPTEQYVAPPVYIRRTGNPEKRMYDPLRQMARKVYSCSTCCS